MGALEGLTGVIGLLVGAALVPVIRGTEFRVVVEVGVVLLVGVVFEVGVVLLIGIEIEVGEELPVGVVLEVFEVGLGSLAGVSRDTETVACLEYASTFTLFFNSFCTMAGVTLISSKSIEAVP